VSAPNQDNPAVVEVEEVVEEGVVQQLALTARKRVTCHVSAPNQDKPAVVEVEEVVVKVEEVVVGEAVIEMVVEGVVAVDVALAGDVVEIEDVEAEAGPEK